ncbi:MAG: hypothetical protein ACRD36_08955, partial [Candidatus Acidiferrum sp.]
SRDGLAHRQRALYSGVHRLNHDLLPVLPSRTGRHITSMLENESDILRSISLDVLLFPIRVCSGEVPHRGGNPRRDHGQTGLPVCRG